jgi:hypothetical protein
VSGSARFAEACRRPFSNGTEEREWMGKWCDYCVHDHDMTHEGATSENGCPLLMEYLVSDNNWGGEGWLPEPDDGKFALPSRLVCLRFEACTKGMCNGDPGAEPRAKRIAEVVAYWSPSDDRQTEADHG